ncbi:MULTISPECIES: acetate--CoA ligase [Spiribacter]|jgi:acetyl-CoA synthetase|uniref:Acetyl-coenzyme A synthetase n=1 Tax=Spiribacter roseus TaxID=1855875 RepID=A0ABV3S0D7_9GAMM|nr:MULTISPECIES: acetate--CoA ligase [Spiribacter]AUB78082.1 acetate--CoA ligase [Spiribacter roseus]KAF0282004.1 acetate--CoA ligase [Spiribacter roseus]KAF0283703.1 acetate--CoA ligase [Spiribacter roseus]KAF0286187.1 acetate--CoA ligase [Spiribacter sp. SSL99]
MAAEKRYPVPPETADHALLSREAYERMYRRSLEAPDAFWAEQAEAFLTWFETWDRVSDNDLTKGQIRWFEGGKLNVSYNCLDRHLDTHGDRNAIIWEGDEPGVTRHITYRELHADVCRLANVLKSRGVSRGDRVSIYMPMIPEAVVAMLACTRIGAVHSIVFGGFSPHALRDRIVDADCRTVITADQGLRSGKPVPLKENVDKAIDGLDAVHSVITVRHTGNPVSWNDARDIDYGKALAAASDECAPEAMDAEDPLFILYTSGSTGKPKGVLHTTGGYLLQAAMTFKYVFDYHDGEVYWCTADVGWITGHSYIVYGPLANGATSLVFEGVPTYPDAGRFWQIIDDHQVNIFYTAPTAIRSLMGQGEALVKKHSRQSLRVLGTVGEPINPEAWEWYYRVVGDERCRIVDTWWQTETGAIMISALPGAIDLKPGSATLPFFGVEPQLVDNEGNVLEGATEGNLCLTRAWPSMMRTIHGDHERFMNTYLTTYPGKYFTGDGARRDEEGYYWITGRVDDVLNVSGHRMGTAEIESALVLHDAVAEAAVVGYPHDLKGQGIYCYVTLVQGTEPSDHLEKELASLVRSEIGPIAKPDVIQWAPGLPKTRSGKIMRRILRKVATNELDSLGDTSTLADPGVVDDLISQRANQ